MEAENHQTTWCAQQAINFIDMAESFDEPWLYSVNFFDPHHDFDPPREYLERYLDRLKDIPLPDYVEGELEDKPYYQSLDHQKALNGAEPLAYPFDDMLPRDHRLIRAAYWAMVDLIDDQVGRILHTLEESGQAQNTIVIFMSDHGEMLGDHGIYLKGPYFYEEAIRVPLIISYPREYETGRERDALVELTDLAPTLLDAVSIEEEPGMQGLSFLPLLTGESSEDHHRDSVYSEYYNAMPTHSQEDVLPFGTMIRTENYKLVRMHGLDTGELYDLESDPSEANNRWGDDDSQSIQLELLGRLSDRMAETVDPLPPRTARW
jgi:arylsulfatase A-like enzyme